MKKLFTVLSVVALGFTSCGDASGDEKNDTEAKVDVCDCLMKAKDEKEAQACAPGKSMEELMAMAKDCDDKMSKDNSGGEMDSNDSKEGDNGGDYDGGDYDGGDYDGGDYDGGDDYEGGDDGGDDYEGGAYEGGYDLN